MATGWEGNGVETGVPWWGLTPERRPDGGTNCPRWLQGQQVSDHRRRVHVVG